MNSFKFCNAPLSFFSNKEYVIIDLKNHISGQGKSVSLNPQEGKVLSYYYLDNSNREQTYKYQRKLLHERNI